MLQFLICLFLISEAQKNDAALVKGVKDTLNVCSDIVEAVGDFLSIFETEERRRADSLGVKVSKKLKVCRQLVELVDAFGKSDFSSMKRGHIALQLNEARFLDAQLKSVVSRKLGETLYIASKDGDSSSVFHKKCDNKGATVVIIQSTNGAVFGGYTGNNWYSSGYRKSIKGFLFRLRPTTTMYPIKSGKESYAIYNHPSTGPRFGAGADLFISNNALSNTKSYTNAGNTYKFPSYPNYQLNDGTKHFQVKDYVVIKAITM